MDTFLTGSEWQNSKKNSQYFKTRVQSYVENYFFKGDRAFSSRSALWHSPIIYGSTAEKLASYAVSHMQRTEWFLQQSQRSCFSVKGTNKMEINLSSRFSMMFLLPQTLDARFTLNPLNIWQYLFLLYFKLLFLVTCIWKLYMSTDHLFPFHTNTTTVV